MCYYLQSDTIARQDKRNVLSTTGHYYINIALTPPYADMLIQKWLGILEASSKENIIILTKITQKLLVRRKETNY